ncbi:MAG TPA: rhomboid family intramembrane serine protease [Acidimicrobiales bacterium]|nr:rhomboid family intramembrane serine protease [Acidimicrobiales bacterium]
MVQAPVGWHCRQCVRRNTKTSPVVRYRPGSAGAFGATQAPVTAGIIAVCVVVYIASVAAPAVQSDGQEVGLLVQSGQWYRLVTSIFVHYSILHIGLDMFSLFIVGRALEPALGWWRYLGLFLVAGFGGAIGAYLLTSPFDAEAGASGAIFGLFGAYFVLARRARLNTSGILTLIVINLVYSFTVPGIAWQAHVGGLLTGLVVSGALGLRRHLGPQRAVTWDLSVMVAVTVALALLLFLPPGVVNLG